MITQINEAPHNVAAFNAIGEVTKEDFQNIVIPAVEQLIANTGQINFLLKLDTDISNFTTGAWFEDVMLGLKNLQKWNRAAIVTDSTTIITFTDIFSYVIPGEFKGFPKDLYNEALAWVSSKNN